MKLTKVVKRIFKTLFVLVILVIGVAIAVPYFFKDEILVKIKEEANNLLNAKVEFADVNLSLIRNFPDFSFEMENLNVVGVDNFDGVKLVKAEGIDFTLDLMSVIKSDRPIEIESITFDKPDVNILVLRDGQANYDIVKPSEPTSEESGSAEYDFLIQLKKYTINDGNFKYDDRAGNMFLELKNLNHSGKGDFTQDVFDLATKTNVEQFSASSGGVQYLKKADVNLDATFNVDLPNNKYTLADNNLRVNAMKLLVDGFVQLQENDNINIDFNFDAPKNDFKNLLSLIPSAYTSDFTDVFADGKMQFNGYVKGIYNGAKEKLPAFKLNLDVDNGRFQYPELPTRINHIYAKVDVESPSSDMDEMRVNIPDFRFDIDGKPFLGKFKLTTPISDPTIDTEIKGTIDLADINKAFPMEGVSELSGILEADIEAKTSFSTLEKGDYENANVTGNSIITNFVYDADDLPKIYISDAQAEFSPSKVKVKNFTGKMGKSDVQVTGQLDNILAYFSPNKTLTGDVKLRSNYFNVDEWMGEETDESVPNETAAEVEIFNRFKFIVDAQIGKIDYDVYQLDNSSATGIFTSNELIINDFDTKLGESDIAGKGNFTNVFNYVFLNETLGGELTMKSDFFDLNPFMEETETPKAKTIANNGEDEYEPIVIPDNVDIDINANIKKLTYTNIDLKDFSGKLSIKDSKVQMSNVNGRTLGGKVTADGYYDSTTPEKPKYKLDYDIKSFDFKNSFEYLNTVKVLAPIAKYIQGNYSTKMSLEGVLGKDLMPDFNTLTADGFLQTVNGVITDFEPIKKIGEALNVEKLTNHKISLKGTKNWFEVKEGNVIVKDFPLKYQGIDMLIGGTHGISQDINYDINAKIPMNLIDQNPVGAAAKKGLGMLNEQASKLGLNINEGEFVNVKIKLTGSMTKPKVQFSLVGSGGKTVKDAIIDKIDDVKQDVVDSAKVIIDDKKEDLTAAVNARKAQLEREANVKIKKLTDAAERSAVQVKKEGEKAAQKLKTEGYKQADLLVQKAGGNPIKKRAAQIAAKKLKKETDKKAQQTQDVANKKADQITQEADKKALQVRNEYQRKIDAVTIDNIKK